jgi:hypothetical protein
MSNTPPLICGTLLAAMVSAGFSHYWSVKEFVEHYTSAPAARMVPANREAPARSNTTAADTPLAENTAPKENSPREEFFQELLAEVRALRNENKTLKNLEDQMAETNRDIMKMGFRLDGYSESFRPLPIPERRDDTTSFEDAYDLPGVLPPRATPVTPLED